MKRLPVENILLKAGIPYRLIELRANAFTVADVMKHSDGDVNPDEVCKTIILHGKKSGNNLAIFLKGAHKVDFKAAKRLWSEEMTIASPEQVMEASGVEPGAVCPFFLSVPLYIDEEVMKLTQVNGGSGHHLYGLEFQLQDLETVKQYEIIKISKTTA